MLTDEGLRFVTERHLATLSSVRADGTPHVTPVGFTWDAPAGLARVICSRSSQKARWAATGRPVALCQVEGRFWLTLEGAAQVSDDPGRVATAVERYAQRYRQPKPNPDRVVIEISVHRLLGTAAYRLT